MLWSRRVLTVLVLAALLSGCTFGEHRTLASTSTRASPSAAGAIGRSPASSSPSATTGWQPFWQGSATFAGGSGQPVATDVRLYPLQVVGSRLLLTVDLTVRPGAGKASLHPFCTDAGCWDLSGVSLIDTTGLARFGPLQAGVAGGPMMTSSTRGPGLRPGATYRFGAFFADPGTDHVAVDLQQAGIVLRVPIETGRLPAANLISTRPVSARWDPAPVTIGGLVTAPVPALVGTFFDNRHGLITSIGGVAVGATPGIVTLGADTLFATGSATPSRAGVAVLTRVAGALARRVDPGRPLLVIGYTDPRGDPAAGLALSRQRADAVATALRPRLKKLQFVTAGRGQDDPVAANTTSSGRDSPSGRALNRRIVIAYSARPAVRGAAGGTGVSPLPSAGNPAAGAVPTSVPAVTGASSPSPDAGRAAPPALVRLGPSVVAAGGRAARLTAGISAVEVDGALSLVTLELRSDRRFTPASAFGTRPPGPATGAGRTAASAAGVGAFHLIDRSSQQVFLPARDADDQTRVAGVFTHRMEPRVSYTYSFLTAALPAGLTTVDVALGDLGTARRVQVRR